MLAKKEYQAPDAYLLKFQPIDVINGSIDEEGDGDEVSTPRDEF